MARSFSDDSAMSYVLNVFTIIIYYIIIITKFV